MEVSLERGLGGGSSLPWASLIHGTILAVPGGLCRATHISRFLKSSSKLFSSRIHPHSYPFLRDGLPASIVPSMTKSPPSVSLGRKPVWDTWVSSAGTLGSLLRRPSEPVWEWSSCMCDHFLWPLLRRRSRPALVSRGPRVGRQAAMTPKPASRVP